METRDGSEVTVRILEQTDTNLHMMLFNRAPEYILDTDTGVLSVKDVEPDEPVVQALQSAGPVAAEATVSEPEVITPTLRSHPQEEEIIYDEIDTNALYEEIPDDAEMTKMLFELVGKVS